LKKSQPTRDFERSAPYPVAVSRIAVAALFILLAACGAEQGPNSSGWKIEYSTNTEFNPAKVNEEFSFDFPRPPGSVHYVTKPVHLAAKNAVEAEFSVEARDSPIFDYHTAPDNTCDAPAEVRLFLQRAGDDMSGNGKFEFYRWWTTSGTVLRAGSFKVQVTLSPALWTSVFGRTGDANPDEFYAAMSDLGQVGVTFGGGCFYGHGVRILGHSAAFTMKKFSVH
jgi:hypothetical protein